MRFLMWLIKYRFYPQLGIHDKVISEDLRHGMVAVKTMEGGQKWLSYNVDKPELLYFVSDHVVEDMLHQVMKMGMDPLGIEIAVNGRKMSYTYYNRHLRLLHSVDTVMA